MPHFATPRRIAKPYSLHHSLHRLFDFNSGHRALLSHRLLISVVIVALFQPTVGLAHLPAKANLRKAGHAPAPPAPAPLAPAVQQAPAGQSFTYLQPGFTQEIIGLSPHSIHIPQQRSDVILGGVAFAPNGDPMVADCGAPGEIHRFDLQGPVTITDGTPLHNQTTLPTVEVCGLTNHPNGLIYGNTVAGG